MNDFNENKKFSIYTNLMQVNMGLHDINLTVYQTTPDNNKIEYGTITMSPQHFKALTYVLLDNLKQYEELFGTIPTPPSDDKVEKLVEEGVISFGQGTK